MDNLMDLVKIFTNNNTNSKNSSIPREVTEQYPYGDFPIRYTRSGQELIRKQSENRYLDEYHPDNNDNHNTIQNNDFSLLFPIIQMLSSPKKQPKDFLNILTKLLFKDNPDMQKLFSLMPNTKSQEVKASTKFSDTNTVKINSLKRV